MPPPSIDHHRPADHPPERDAVTRAVDAIAFARNNPARVALPVMAVLIAVFALWRAIAPSGSSAPESQIPLATAATARVTSTVSTVHTVAVHMAGAIEHGGVLMLPDGSRVIDAVNAAGGPTPDADLGRVNLAAKLVDGTRIYIPRVGEQPLADDAGDVNASAPRTPVNLNTATVDQLDALPGIGPATAAAIIAYRHDHGPFRSVDDLLEIRGIGPAKLEELRSQVTV